MIFVQRSDVKIPGILEVRSPQKVRALEDARKHFSIPNNDRRQIRFKFKESLFRSKEVKEALSLLFHNKCAFCESPIGIFGWPDVDHFRPRTYATSLTGEIQEDHYWWLAYEWSNLYPICSVCDYNKGRRFPVNGPRATVGSSGDELLNEGSLLIDPCSDNPEDHLLFTEDGFVAGITDKGNVTIDLFGLNRKELVEARLAEIETVLLVTKIAGDNERDLKWLDDLQGQLTKVKSPYLGAKRQVIARWLQRNMGARTERSLTQKLTQAALDFAAESITDETVRIAVDALVKILPRVSSDAESRRVVQLHNQLEQRESEFSTEDEIDPNYFRKTRLVERIEIKDFKGIRNIEIDLKSEDGAISQWLMLLGENGAGKSSILQAVCLTLVGERYLDTLNIKPSDFIRKGARQAVVRVFLSNHPEPVTLTIKPNAFQPSSPSSKVLIIAYGATRLLPRDENPSRVAVKHAKVDNLFDPFVPVGDARSWLGSLKTGQFDIYARALKELFLVLDGPEELVRVGKRIEVKTGTTTLPLDLLSDGYQSVIGVTADIMRVMSHYWTAMEVAEGIVIIDELGAHLHPRWRMRVVTGLRRAFPRVQFLVSTHDPLCLRGILENEIRVLRQNVHGDVIAISEVPAPETMRVEQLLTSEHFGLYSTENPQLDAEFNDFTDLAGKLILSDFSAQVFADESLKLEKLRDSLDRQTVLGRDRRERMMLEAIDLYLAQEKFLVDGLVRRQTREKTLHQLVDIWRNELPIPEGPFSPGTGNA